MTCPPKFKVGDTIYWYCTEDKRIHHAEVQFVNFAKAGDQYIEVNYEVEVDWNGQKRTLFIDDYDASAIDYLA
jgi:Golgi nucleoside diphosphatase